MNRQGRRIVRPLVAVAAVGALAVPSAADAGGKRHDHAPGKSADAKQKRPAGNGSGRRIR